MYWCSSLTMRIFIILGLPVNKSNTGVKHPKGLNELLMIINVLDNDPSFFASSRRNWNWQRVVSTRSGQDHTTNISWIFRETFIKKWGKWVCTVALRSYLLTPVVQQPCTNHKRPKTFPVYLIPFLKSSHQTLFFYNRYLQLWQKYIIHVYTAQDTYSTKDSHESRKNLRNSVIIFKLMNKNSDIGGILVQHLVYKWTWKKWTYLLNEFQRWPGQCEEFHCNPRSWVGWENVRDKYIWKKKVLQ